ncbi:UNVERIFIED_CONTAM: hypothetical protein GTU68_056384 [Idotea baltica]|nr:hypothetical protein [Idotea baltica]
MVSGDPNASLLTRITQLDPMYVNFSAPNKDVNYIRDGLKKGLIVNDNQKLKVSIILSDGSVYPMPGNVNFTDSLIDTATGSVNARAVVPNKKLKLLPGQFVRVKVEGLYLPDAITVPERSISQGPKGTFVYVVDDKNIAHQRKVNVGYTSNNRWLVTSGLKEGEQIIVEGVSKTRPETPVRIAPKDPIPNAAPGATTATKTNLKNSK